MAFERGMAAAAVAITVVVQMSGHTNTFVISRFVNIDSNGTILLYMSCLNSLICTEYSRGL